MNPVSNFTLALASNSLRAGGAWSGGHSPRRIGVEWGTFSSPNWRGVGDIGRKVGNGG